MASPPCDRCALLAGACRVLTAECRYLRGRIEALERERDALARGVRVTEAVAAALAEEVDPRSCGLGEDGDG